MIDITIRKYTRGPDSKMFKKKVPAVPQVGDHVASDNDGFSGYVDRRSFWWDEDGKLIIEVVIK